MDRDQLREAEDRCKLPKLEEKFKKKRQLSIIRGQRNFNALRYGLRMGPGIICRR